MRLVKQSGKKNSHPIPAYLNPPFGAGRSLRSLLRLRLTRRILRSCSAPGLKVRPSPHLATGRHHGAGRFDRLTAFERRGDRWCRTGDAVSHLRRAGERNPPGARHESFLNARPRVAARRHELGAQGEPEIMRPSAPVCVPRSGRVPDCNPFLLPHARRWFRAAAPTRRCTRV